MLQHASPPLQGGECHSPWLPLLSLSSPQHPKFPATGECWSQRSEEGAPLCSSCPPRQFPFSWEAVFNPCSQRRESKRSLLFSGEVLKPSAPMHSKRLIFIYHFFLRCLCFQMKVFVVAVLQGNLGWPRAPGLAHRRRSMLGPGSCS